MRRFPRKKILIADPMDPEVLKGLKKKFNVTVKTGLTKEGLIRIIPDYEALIGRTSTKLDKDVFAAAKNLKVVGVHATGWDHIDVGAATKHGVALLGYPSNNAGLEKERFAGSFVPVAEHVMLVMLAAAGDFYNMCASMKAGRWDKYKFSGTELFGKTLGIVGLGRIGSLVADRARAFGMRIMAFDRSLTMREASKRGVERVALDTLCKESDFITLHVPKTKETIGLMNAKRFKQMKRGVILVNTARAAVVDDKALMTALKKGIVRAAAIDVFEYPLHGVNRELVKMKNVLPTPHIAGISRESLSRVSTYISKSVSDYLLSGEVRGLINPKVRR